MLGFFNTQHSWKKALQAYNLLALTLATYTLATDPDASKSELGADILVHYVTILSLRENTSCFTAMASSLLNTARIGAIYGAVTSGCSSATSIFNALDVTNHFVNMLGSLAAGCDKKEPDSNLTALAKRQ